MPFSVAENAEENIQAEFVTKNVSPEFTPLKPYLAASIPCETKRGCKSVGEISEYDVSENESEEFFSLTDAYRQVMSASLTDFDCFAKVSQKKKFKFDD